MVESVNLSSASTDLVNKINCNLFTREKYKQTKKNSDDYLRLKRADIISVAGNEKLISSFEKEGAPAHYYLCVEEMYDVIHETHVNTGYVGHKKCGRNYNVRAKILLNNDYKLLIVM